MEPLSLLLGSGISFLSFAIAGQNDRGRQQQIISAVAKRFLPNCAESVCSLQCSTKDHFMMEETPRCDPTLQS